MLSEREALIGLNMVEGLGSTKLGRLLEDISSARGVWSLPYKDLCKIDYLGESLAQAIDEFRMTDKLSDEIALADSLDVNVVTISDKGYPPLLRQINDPPVLLYVKGRLPESIGSSIAIVGSRRASFYGTEHAQRFAYGLSELGITVVSGFARGIDTAAHIGAVKAGGATVAVLGSGLDRIYPRQNKALVGDVVKNGAVISELPLSSEPLAFNFPRRNRIVAGLSLGVIVIEASARSGALITASIAVEEGRDVFALPGQVSSPVSAGCNNLIKEGARMLTDISDIIDEYNGRISVRDSRASHEEISCGELRIDLTDSELKVYNGLNSTSRAIDDILISSGVKIGELMSALVSLQTKHLVKELPGKRFMKITV